MGRLQRLRLLCRARTLSHARAPSEGPEREQCSWRQPSLAASLAEPQQHALAMLSPPGKDHLPHPQAKQAGHREPQSARRRSPSWDGLGLGKHIRCDACALFAAPERQKLPTESCWRHLKNNLYSVVKAGVPVGALNRWAFAELKPEFPGETAKLSPFRFSLSRGESRSKRRSPTTQPCRNTAAWPSKAAPRAQLPQNHLSLRALGKKLPCRHPASAECGDAEPLPAPVSQRRRSSRCLH